MANFLRSPSCLSGCSLHSRPRSLFLFSPVAGGSILMCVCLLLALAWFSRCRQRLEFVWQFLHIGILAISLCPPYSRSGCPFTPYYFLKARLSASLSPVVGVLFVYSCSRLHALAWFPAVDAVGFVLQSTHPVVWGGIPPSFGCVSL